MAPLLWYCPCLGGIANSAQNKEQMAGLGCRDPCQITTPPPPQHCPRCGCPPRGGVSVSAQGHARRDLSFADMLRGCSAHTATAGVKGHILAAPVEWQAQGPVTIRHHSHEPVHQVTRPDEDWDTARPTNGGTDGRTQAYRPSNPLRDTRVECYTAKASRRLQYNKVRTKSSSVTLP